MIWEWIIDPLAEHRTSLWLWIRQADLQQDPESINHERRNCYIGPSELRNSYLKSPPKNTKRQERYGKERFTCLVKQWFWKICFKNSPKSTIRKQTTQFKKIRQTKDLDRPFKRDRHIPNKHEACEKILGLSGHYENVNELKSTWNTIPQPEQLDEIKSVKILMTSTAGKTAEHLEPSAMAHLRKARCAAFWDMGLTVSFDVMSATAKQYSGATSGCSSKRKGTVGSHQPLCGHVRRLLVHSCTKKERKHGK